MKKNHTELGSLFVSLFAAAVLTHSTASAEESKGAADEGHKHGDSQCQNNNCKGHADCAGYGNASCGGMNSCKGHGHLEAKNEAECVAKKGLWHGKKSETKEHKKSKKG